VCEEYEVADHQSQDDESLMRLVAGGRADALGRLYDRYGRLVFSLALHSVGDAATAEEITQDVFLRAWERGGQYRPDQGTVRAWLASIARHRSIDQLRRQGARAEAYSVSWDAMEDALEGGLTGGSPQGEAELAIQQAAVRAAVAELPEEQKQVLALAYFRGHTQAEIAAALGLPLGTVKTRIRLAMDKLRAALRDQT
jgi:RNA polymerase sigma-70 factor (ECF subfamily)